ncbi:MAG: GerMN domain-containing protein [Ilumatobacteraceae bacterium]|nr:GerMN domain-containing protein [Ilumatobacteraceae bacterium]
MKRSHSPHLRHFATVGAILLMITACGLQTDSEATLFDDIPYGLAETSTSTTTTTIATDPVPGTTTTTVVADQQTVDVVYVRRFSRELESTQVDLPFPVSGRDLLDQLSSPPADAQPELETEVSRNLVLSFGVDRGLATVNLSRSAINQLGSAQQRRAIAQIVLTLTLFTSDEGGIGQIIFLVGGQPISVYVPLLGANSEPGQPVAWTDYSQLLVGIDARPPASTTSTTTPVATTTSVATTSIPPSTSVPTDSTTIPSVPETSVPESTTTSTTAVADESSTTSTSTTVKDR